MSFLVMLHIRSLLTSFLRLLSLSFGHGLFGVNGGVYLYLIGFFLLLRLIFSSFRLFDYGVFHLGLFLIFDHSFLDLFDDFSFRSFVGLNILFSFFFGS